MSLTECGDHTGAAYSKKGLASKVYNRVKARWLDEPTVRLAKPRIRFALLTTLNTWVFHVKWCVIVIPKSLTSPATLSFLLDM